MTSRIPRPVRGLRDIPGSLPGIDPSRCRRVRCCRRSPHTGTSGIHRRRGIRRAGRYAYNGDTREIPSSFPHGISDRDDTRPLLPISASFSGTFHDDHAWNHGRCRGFSLFLHGFEILGPMYYPHLIGPDPATALRSFRIYSVIWVSIPVTPDLIRNLFDCRVSHFVRNPTYFLAFESCLRSVIPNLIWNPSLGPSSAISDLILVSPAVGVIESTRNLLTVGQEPRRRRASDRRAGAKSSGAYSS
jgi:hypothetical protein